MIFAVMLVLAYMGPDGELEIRTRRIEAWRDLTATQRCQKLAEAFVSPPIAFGQPEMTREWSNAADKRYALCWEIAPNGKPL